jgi:hypothetical protein
MTFFSMTEVCLAVMREGITCYIEHTGGGTMTLYAGTKVDGVWTVAAGPGRRAQLKDNVIGVTGDFYVGQGIPLVNLWTCPSNATVADIAAEIIHQVQTHVAAPEPEVLKTWPENDAERDAFMDWQYQVVQGETVLGFRDWLVAEKERDVDQS